jgi:multicomponent Na+:H+ antiporter subunit B|tara:strand:- start:1047 stop:1640 length:594 start_codon:yes stop_codon:yes gene_type:complete
MIDLTLLFFLVVCALAAISMKDMLNTTIILGAYSLIMAVVWTRLNAVDVAFTEAAVGAGITTVLIIATLSRTDRRSGRPRKLRGQESEVMIKRLNTQNTKLTNISSPLLRLISLFIVLITGAVLIYGTIDMPDFGDPDAPANTHVAQRYIEKSYEEAGVVNFVTAILASYRGYDTLGEVAVIFTAGISVVLLLRRKR